MKASRLSPLRTLRAGGRINCRPSALALCLAAGLISLSPAVTRAQTAPAPLSTQPARVNNASDVIEVWQAHQHLYLKGDLGVSQDQLDGLEQWLDANGTNWTVLLLETAADEQYTASDGRRFDGIEAVNYALGQGLANRTGFNQLRDPRTQEPYGAIFVLSLKDRKFSYFGSDAQDKRGLGEDAWIGNLDAQAIAAMRAGGRVVDAVRNTVSEINRRVDARISAEIQEQKNRAAAEREAHERALAQAKAALGAASDALATLEAKSAEFNRNHPGPSGDLARPDLARWQGELRLLRNAVETGETKQVQPMATAVQTQVEARLRLLAQYPNDRAKLDELDAALRQIVRHRYAAAVRSRLDSAKERLGVARREYQRGDSSYPTHLEPARLGIAEARLAAEAAARAALQRRSLLGLGAFSVLCLFGMTGLFLNRRRAGQKREAESLSQAWKKALDEKNSALVGLLDRRDTFIGSSSQQAADRYSGDTLELSKQIINGVDELFIMSACAGRILRDAEALLRPKGFLARAGNLVRARRYQQALRLLRDQPVGFSPEESLEHVMRGPRSERDRLVGDLKSFQPFTMSFNQLLEAFNERASRAVSALDQVSSSLNNGGKMLEETQQLLEQARALEAALLQEASADGLFRLAPLFSKLVPSAQTALSNATQRALTDPVGALRGPGAQSRQQTEDALTLANLLAHARKSRLPSCRERAAALAQNGPPSQWVQARLAELSEQADRAALDALQGPVASQIKSLEDALAELDNRTARALELDQIRRERSAQDIAAATAAIESARRDIGAALGTEPDKVLRESDADPSERVRQAQAQIEAAFAALSRGDVAAASNALEAVGQLTGQAVAIVNTSRKSLADHAQALAWLQTETDRIAALVPQHREILESIQTRYAASVLVLGAGDPAHPAANGTTEDNITEAEAHLAAAREEFAQADSAFRAARLLEAASLREQVRGRQETAAFRLEEIVGKERRLAKTEEANRQQLSQLEARFRACQENAAAPTTTLPTVHLFEEAGSLFHRAGTAIQAGGGDPFQVAADLAEIERKFTEVLDKARCDRDLFEEAQRSLQAAERQLAEAVRLAQQSLVDNIADSAAVRQARAQADTLAKALPGVQQAIGQNHGDWRALDAEADRIAREASSLAASLRGELQKAQAALSAVSAAAAAVRTAGAWTGSYGVVVLGSPGSDLLAQARAILQQGQYDEAKRQADWARQKAQTAVNEAELAVEQRRRLEEEERERERRRRAAAEAARRASWNSGSFGSGSSSRSSSWGHSGSGASTSSFSSGSGFKTSGW